VEISEEEDVLFVDEIHRFNRAQQDAFLPHVERGTIVLIGATTENPSFEVIGPLLSRTKVFTLNPLTEEQIGVILRGALEDKERGLGEYSIDMGPDVMEAISRLANGDARIGLNTLEMVVFITPRMKRASDTLQKRRWKRLSSGRLFFTTKLGRSITT